MLQLAVYLRCNLFRWLNANQAELAENVECGCFFLKRFQNVSIRAFFHNCSFQLFSDFWTLLTEFNDQMLQNLESKWQAS